MEPDAIYGKRSIDLDGIKELKVKVSLRLHVKLHGLKLLHGKTMSGTVTEALEAYFERIEPASQVVARSARREAPTPVH